MKYKVRVVNKNTGMNCFIYQAVTVDDLMIILNSLSNLDTDLYFIDIKNEEER
nr:MAG TPA: hypothetical protein [Caudoviricetes sp.]